MGQPLKLKDKPTKAPEDQNNPWRVLIVDDEEEVHRVTLLALKHFEFDGRGLWFLHAHSAAEAREIMLTEGDIAVVLLDVVMETDHAGLGLIGFIRSEIENHSTRIVLRTGQPGQAPEHKVIKEYDINDYKDKTELTATKLFTLLISCLRAYRDICTLNRSKKGLEKLILASRGISSRQELGSFVNITLHQLVTLLNLDDAEIFSCETEAFRVDRDEVLQYSFDEDIAKTQKILMSEMLAEKRAVLRQVLQNRTNVYQGNFLGIYCASKHIVLIFYARTDSPLSSLDIHLLNTFTENLVVVLENIRLNEVITESQREMIYRLGEVVETRSNETGNHVKRVAHYSEILARLAGLNEEEATLIKFASPLHDIGKIGVADAILNKQGRLTADERDLMENHTSIGYSILKGSGLILMDVGAIIARDHHENWDGSGYPKGKRREEIHIHGRITALADVFDALCSERCYKEPWPDERVKEYISEQSGSKFDPRLAQLFLDNFDRFVTIRDCFSD
ncbi:MAG: DUF3369 domain-containing protein [Gammaproteobacteria bacterium]|nr:DUF3369 domain-containing protein [Gammaproteobacteria bacterium]